MGRKRQMSVEECMRRMGKVEQALDTKGYYGMWEQVHKAVDWNIQSNFAVGRKPSREKWIPFKKIDDDPLKDDRGGTMVRTGRLHWEQAKARSRTNSTNTSIQATIQARTSIPYAKIHNEPSRYAIWAINKRSPANYPKPPRTGTKISMPTRPWARDNRFLRQKIKKIVIDYIRNIAYGIFS